MYGADGVVLDYKPQYTCDHGFSQLPTNETCTYENMYKNAYPMIVPSIPDSKNYPAVKSYLKQKSIDI